MTKQEFIDELSRSLVGKVEPNRLQDIIKYYNDYIMIEMRQGKSEQEVLYTLGSPRLIAKSIVDAEGIEDMDYTDQPSEESDYEHFGLKWKIIHMFSGFPLWIKRTIIWIIAFLIMAIIFRVAVFLLPIFVPIILVVFIIRLWEK